MSKKKITVKVAPGQAIFVADKDVLEHIANLYNHMAQDSEDPASWLSIAEDIYEWVNKTYIPEQDGYEEEEW
jgi:hypothetical protein